MRFWITLLLPLAAVAAEKPVALYSGMGNWKHPIATRSAEAQKFFDQGLALNYGFNRYEAVRSFRKAAELDPQAPMPYWGLAMAFGPYINMDGDSSYDIRESCSAVAKGLALAQPAGEERALLDAAATRCPEFGDPSRYSRAMRELAQKYPDDLDAQVFYADALMVPVRWRWYGADGTPAEGVAEAERVLEGVLRRNNNHPGANHLYIHAVESSTTPERAIPSSQRLMGLMGGAGHMVHMPGHIWLVTGDFNNTVAVNERGAAADRAYFAQTGVMSGYYMYYLHNLNFIIYARMMQGRIAETRKAEKQYLDAAAPMAQMMPEMAGILNAVVTMAELRINRWDDLLAAPKPKAEDTITQAMWHYSRSVAQAFKGFGEKAREEQAQFEKLRTAADKTGMWGVNRLGDVLEMASAALEARLTGTPALWEKAVALQDALVYDEPPAWYYPLRESLGAARLKAGDAAGAEAVFRDGLRRSPNNGRMLFGLLESLKAQKKSDGVAEVQRELDAAWKGADLVLKLDEL